MDAVCIGTPRSCAISSERVKSLCIVLIWLPVPMNLRSMMFSRVVFTKLLATPEVLTTSYRTWPSIPALAARADASQVAVADKIVISGADNHIKIGESISLDGDGDGGYSDRVYYSAGHVDFYGLFDDYDGGSDHGANNDLPCVLCV